ncbi:hypothetical protein NEOLEDRAFT_1182025 [Neolentinus lepideus HHB14362 ss-1]|uniref:Uncharacterized protein n=1 Tax=Neolentinus lepideus HHB14362 ss-1 TaxID=1314782 RepID=A0A165PIY2_9AGAM|nr:hypothetical protein NEOLEDRAFT_1182025 [Neolentinus lepideus HHB14362 ss-1]
MATISYMPHIIYSLALTSVSMNMLYQRKLGEAQKASISAQTTILESLAQRLRSGENFPEEEVERLWNLARKKGETTLNPHVEEIGLKETFLGKKLDAEETARVEEWERLEIEQLKQAFFKEADS